MLQFVNVNNFYAFNLFDCRDLYLIKKKNKKFIKEIRSKYDSYMNSAIPFASRQY